MFKFLINLFRAPEPIDEFVQVLLDEVATTPTFDAVCASYIAKSNGVYAD